MTAFFATLAFGLERWSIAAAFLAAVGAAACTQIGQLGVLTYRAQTSALARP